MSGFKLTHFEGGGKSLGSLSSSVGGIYTTPPTSGGTSFSVGAQRHGEIFRDRGVNIATAQVNQQINSGTSAYIGASTGFGKHGKQAGSGVFAGFGVKF